MPNKPSFLLSLRLGWGTVSISSVQTERVSGRVNSILLKALLFRSCRYAIDDLRRGVVMCVTVALKGTIAMNTL